MLRRSSHAVIPSFMVLAISLFGCGGADTSRPSDSAETSGPPATIEVTHEHAHPAEGPHGGSIVELGTEEYHAELIHDDQAGTITVYLLDSAAKASVAIDAPEMTINLKHDGRGEQFKLAASAAPDDPQGKSSRFVSTNAELAEDMDQQGADAQLVVTINGKQYRGAINHDHEQGDSHEH